MMKAIYRLIVRLMSAVLESLNGTKRIEAELKEIKEEQADQRQILEDQQKFLEEILAAVEPLPAVGFVITVELEGQIIEGAKSVSMTNSQQATATIQPVDKKGQPAPIDGVPEWASSDETIVTVTPAADGLSAVVAAVGPLGSARVSVTGDADLTGSVKPIFGELSVNVTQGEAVGFKISLGEPTEQGTGPVPEP